VKRNSIFPTVLATAAAFASLSGCSMFHGKSESYTAAAESRPLEVPPDLDSPSGTNELIVPPPGHGAAATAGVAGAPPSAAAPAGAAPSNELLVETDVQNAWLKVGAALDRAKLGTVDARDAGAHTYAFAFDAPVDTKPKGETHWYTAIANHLGFGEGDPIKARLTIRVADEGGASRVTVLAITPDKASSLASLRIVQELHDAFPGIKVSDPHAPVAAAAPVVAAAPVAAPVAPVAAAPAATPAPAVQAAPAATAPVAISPPSSDVAPAGATELHVADTVAHTWTRVGLALERAQIGTLSGRDENARTYTLDFNGTVTVETQQPAAEHHWYSRILHPFGGDTSTKAETVARVITVRVSDDKGGARVSVEGNASDKTTSDAVQRVTQVLRERLS